nr:MAG TPA: Translation initiation factor IF-1 initiation factor, Burkholderia thailandensis [Caudoviricetes sp.]
MPGVQGSADLGTAVWIRPGDCVRPGVPVLSNVCEKNM